MKLKLAFSTCPNDTFIFDALVHHKIDTEGLNFEVVLADVEELNKAAFKGKADITKLSFHAFAKAAKNYLLLNAGSALGKNNGPLLICKNKNVINNLKNAKVGIPGENTTAALLLKIIYPEIKNSQEFLFSDIEKAVLSGKIDAGLIIHENRFTYAQKGLLKIADLGQKWEELTNIDVPLGGIVVNRKLPIKVQQKVDRLVRKSIEYAYENPNSSLEYIRQFAQEMENDVMQKHIDLYVNNFSIDLGKDGKIAINRLYEEAEKQGLIQPLPKQIFVS